MSNSVFPSLPGLNWPKILTPRFSTKVQRAVSGKEYRAKYMQYPIYKFTLPYELWRDTASFSELQQVMGFFNQHNGAFDNFLFTNPVDYAVTGQSFGTGDGNTTAFQLIRTYGYGSFTANDLVQNLNGSANNVIYNNGVVVPQGGGANNCTVSSTGLVTFNSAPAVNSPLTWTGQYYYRCRFADDELDFSEFMNGLWNGEIEFFGSPQNKL